MRLPLGRILVALSLALASASAVVAGAAHAQIAYTPCGESNVFACGHVTVPLDPGGAVGGTLTLALRRHRASVGEAHTAIIALAGGPGQPALPFAEDFAETLGPIAATRDLIVFDQRGIGLSDPLSCHAFEHPSTYAAFGPLVEACAAQLGTMRSYYTTADTVADIEAIRQAGGYEKLVLYGTSYGTKVAELYAQTYPSHVEALVLDSVVTPNGPDPLERPTFAAIPRILRQMCAARACAHITANPLADLAQVLARMRRRPLRANVIGGEGKPRKVSVSAQELIELLLAGDFSREKRAEFITAIAAAARDDEASLARLTATSSLGEGEGEDFDEPLYFATTCEEQDFPWKRNAKAKTRLAEARAAARALPARAFAPFTPLQALAAGDIEACARWPYTAPAPTLDSAAFSSTPTLILSGAEDLRTPTSGARELAAQIPNSHLLVVPYTGHAVLEDEPSSCAREAMIALFAGTLIKPCASEPPPSSLRPPPLPPLRVGLISPQSGYRGSLGRTLHAVRLTLADLTRELLEQILSGEGLTSGTAIETGGLRSGWAQLAGGRFTFHRYSYIPGLTISGTLGLETAHLRIGGSGAVQGTLRRGSNQALVGVFDGRHVRLPANRTASAAIVGEDAQESYHPRSGGSTAFALARRLTSLLGGI